MARLSIFIFHVTGPNVLLSIDHTYVSHHHNHLIISDYRLPTIVQCASGIGDVTDSSTWQTLGGGVADYLSALPLPLHHLLKYSTPVTVESKREDQPTIVTTVNANALNGMQAIATVSKDRKSLFIKDHQETWN